MKYLKTKNAYKASNLYIDMNKVECISYDWWIFSKIVKSRLIFNNAHYSNTTNRHQLKSLSQLKLLGYAPDLILKYTRRSLTNLNDALRDELKHIEVEQLRLRELMSKPRTHKSKNIERYQLLLKLGDHAAHVKCYI